MSLLDRWVRPLVNQPLSRPVPAEDDAYRRRKGDTKLALRALRRALQFAASGQAASKRDRIDPAWRRALWIHEEAPQIGDALMDLAPRSLLAERGFVVDLLAPPAIAALFAGDRWLGEVYADPAAIDSSRHDFAICSSDARRALAAKRALAPALPWVSLAGRYNAPDYQRAMFDAQRLADLLGVTLDDAAMRWHARQKLDIRRSGEAATGDGRAATDDRVGEARTDDGVRDTAPRSSPRRVAIACGGVRAERTYRHWPQVAAALAARGLDAFLLVGSANGRSAADAIRAALPAGCEVIDHVGRIDLHATQAAIAAADRLLCADGGLMHLGLTTSVPVVALFTSTVDPVWRWPPGGGGATLRSTTPFVDDVAPARVVDAARSVVAGAAA